jgi:hypothetical protein
MHNDPTILQAFAETQGVYGALEELAKEAFGRLRWGCAPTVDAMLTYVATDLAETLRERATTDPRLAGHDLAWLAKKAHEVLATHIDQVFQQPMNRELGLPLDWRG